MTTVDSSGAGGLSGQLEATLDVTVGRLAAVVDRLMQREQEFVQLWQDLHIVPIWAQPIAGSAGTSDQADKLGPKDGYWWDLRRLSAWGFTAGTVTVTLNDVNGEQVALFPQAGQWSWSGNLFLGPRDRLVIVTTGITGGPVQIQGQAVEISTQQLPNYLM
jgi:hypothetical protein